MKIKKLQKNIRMSWMYKMMSIIVLIMAALWLILLGMHETEHALVIMTFCLLLLIVFSAIGFITGCFKAASARRRILSQGDDFNEAIMEKTGDTLYLSDEWLVWRNKEEWLFWRRDKVSRIVILHHNQAGTRADIVVYRYGERLGTALHVNALDYGKLNLLENWTSYTN